MTTAQCQELCVAYGAACVGFEFGVDHGGDSGVRSPYYRQTFLDGAHTGRSEMLLGAATVAFQSLSAERERRVGTVDSDPGNLSQKPFYLGGCYSLAEGSEVVQKFYPQFFERDSDGEE